MFNDNPVNDSGQRSVFRHRHLFQDIQLPRGHKSNDALGARFIQRQSVPPRTSATSFPSICFAIHS
jgi:hypothetical protein